MPELNQSLYNTCYESLTGSDVPEHLADAVARIVAVDDPNLPNLGRNEIDIELCGEAVQILLTPDKEEGD
ncbi:hypothetical protein [Calothrix sp. UHCC 0171]|uniref:hypothetical protein n=1 Tax=Calothrix sp. UHCC 0171 TaxID=3110245 RepID=UPI002B1E95A8|nr:hypothetical protein [Calothrix sp. UHCC 0171]MEA5574791.1 hypothetical protein [Calothrix sp. UHCC 0171]